MQHFEPITAENRYKNEMMDHMRRQTEALEQLAQLLKPPGCAENRIKTSGRSRKTKEDYSWHS